MEVWENEKCGKTSRRRVFPAQLFRGGRLACELKGVGMLVVSLRGVNVGFWSHLGCSEERVIICSPYVAVKVSNV